MKTKTLFLSTLVMLICGIGTQTSEASTIFSDDYDAAWDATPIPLSVLNSLIGLPDVSGGVARGIGSGYTSPYITWMAKPLTFTAEAFEITIRGESGPSWPNSAEIWLMDPSWGGHGQPPAGYRFGIYGESSYYRFYVHNMAADQDVANWYIGSEITNWHTYVVSRDTEGNWALTMDGIPKTASSMIPDMSITEFTYIGSFLFRNQSALDYVEIETTQLPVSLDIKPQSCPNPVNVKSKGVLPVAIVGNDSFDVGQIDVASIRLEGVAPLRSAYEDVATPVLDEAECACTTEGPDGYMDLTLKFDTQEIMAALGEVSDGEEWLLYLTGLLYDGLEIEGSDCIQIIKKGN